MRLGELLVKDGVITVDQLDAALRAKVLYGGRLGSNLVETDALDLDQLANALGKLHAVPIASEADIAAADTRFHMVIPRDVAARYLAIPLGMAKIGRRLTIACCDPRDDDAIAALAFLVKMPVVPHVAPEIRLRAALENKYGVARPSRYVRMLDPMQIGGPVRAPRPEFGEEGMPSIGMPPTAPVAPPAPLTIELPPPTPGRSPVAHDLLPPVAAPPQPEPPVAVPGPRSNAGTLIGIVARQATPRPRAALGADACLALLATAADRDEIGALLVDHLRQGFGAAIVLLAKHELALGWKGFAPGLDGAEIEALALPLSMDSLFRTAWLNGEIFHGSPPVKVLHIHFWKAIKAAPPTDVVVAPVAMKGRIVNLVYAHADGGKRIDDALVSDLERVAAGVAEAYARLIHSGKTPR